MPTYYFDASDAAATDPNAAWTNDANVFDAEGSTPSTFARVNAAGTASSNYLMAEGTNAPSSGRVISNVRVRMYVVVFIYSTLSAAVYTDGLGTLLGTTTKAGGAGWTNYATLSTPEGGWTWPVVQALEVKLFQSSTGDTDAYIVEIEVFFDTGPASSNRTLEVGNGMSRSEKAS